MPLWRAPMPVWRAPVKGAVSLRNPPAERGPARQLVGGAPVVKRESRSEPVGRLLVDRVLVRGAPMEGVEDTPYSSARRFPEFHFPSSYVTYSVFPIPSWFSFTFRPSSHFSLDLFPHCLVSSSHLCE